MDINLVPKITDGVTTHFPETINSAINKIDVFDKYLKPHQEIIWKYFVTQPNVRGLLIYFDPGYGKSILASKIAETLSTERDIIVMLPKSITENFKRIISSFAKLEGKTDENTEKMLSKYTFISINSSNMAKQLERIASKVVEVDVKKGANDTKSDEIDTKTNTKSDEIDTKTNTKSDEIDTKTNTKSDEIDTKIDTKSDEIDTKSDEIDTKIDTKTEEISMSSSEFVNKFFGIDVDSEPDLVDTETMTPKKAAIGLKKLLQAKFISEYEIDTSKISLDGKLIIIDEAHNIFNAITNGSKNAIHLYNAIMKATDIKLLFLTGTPIINHPFEIVPCINMLAGYIRLDPNIVGKQKARQQVTTLLPEMWDDFNMLFIDGVNLKNKSKLQNRIHGLVSYYGERYYMGDTTNDEVEQFERKMTERGDDDFDETQRVSGKYETSEDDDRFAIIGGGEHWRKFYHKSKSTKSAAKTKNIEIKNIETISFPEEEIENYSAEIAKDHPIFTVRVDKEFGRYQPKTIYFNEHLGKLRVVEVHNVETPEDIPWWKTIPKYFQDEIRQHSEHIQWIKLRAITEGGAHEPDAKHKVDFGRFLEVARKTKENALAIPADFDPFDMFTTIIKRQNFPDELPTIIKRIPMSTAQFENYMFMRFLEHEESKRWGGPRVYSALSKPRSEHSNTYRIKSRKACNYLIPSYAKTVNDITDADLLNAKYFGPKLAELTHELARWPGLGFVYTSLVHGEGVKIIERTLIVLGYRKFDVAQYVKARNAPNFGENIVSETVRAGYGAEFVDVQESALFNGGKTFVVLTGDEPANTEEKHALIEMFTSDENIRGKICRILIVSRVGSEGMDLRAIRHEHIFEPYWNYARIGQIKARGIRMNSCRGLRPDECNCQPIIYLSDYPADLPREKVALLEDTTDIYIYKRAMINKVLIDETLTMLQETSIDCMYHNSRHNAGLNCKTCMPNSRVLFIPDVRRDIELSNPCIQPVKKRVQVKEILMDSAKFYYAIDAPAKITVYTYNDATSTFLPVNPNAPIFRVLIEKIREKEKI